MPLIPIPIGQYIDFAWCAYSASFWIACGIVIAMLVIIAVRERWHGRPF